MKKTSVGCVILIFVLSFLWCSFQCQCAGADMKFPAPPGMLPLPKKDMRTGGQIQVGPGSELAVPPSFAGKYKAAVESARKTISSLPGGNGKVKIQAVAASQSAAAEGLPEKPGGYLIEIGGKGITVTGRDDQGILNGLTTLEVLLINEKGRLRMGKVLDWPDLTTRAVHIMQKDIAPETVEQLITAARYGHFNLLLLSLADGVRIPSMERMLGKRPWTKEELLKVANYANENGMTVVPELRLLTHQEKFLKQGHPQLMFNHSTYNPDNPETYKVVFKIMDDIIDILKPKAMHIGHDEIAGYKDDAKSLPMRLLKDEKMLPPELFFKDVEILHNHLKERGVETWMWGDMLISPDEFPQMQGRQLHGHRGYSAIRSRISKDIVICDWHFGDKQKDFPSASAFANQGNRVLGATFINPETTRNFSRYVAGMPRGGEGMIVALWGMVRRDKTEVVHDMLKVAANSFWNAK